MTGDSIPSNDTGDSRDSDARPPKRHRITLACTWCREKKSRCDGTRPECSTCKKHGIECQYEQISSLSKTAASKEYLDSLISRLSKLEGSVTGLHTRVNRLEGGNTESNGTISERPDEDEDESAYAEDMDHAQDTQDPTDGIGSIQFTKDAESAFFGPSSNIALTRQIVRATTTIMRTSAAAADPASPVHAHVQSHMLHVSRPQSPEAQHVRPQPFSAGVEPFILPQRDETRRLVDLFFLTTGMLFPYIDRASLLARYEHMASTNLRNASKSWLGLLNMVLAMSTSASSGGPYSADERSSRSEIFFRRAMAICDKEIRHGTSLEVVQLLILMSQYLQGTERSIETWNLHGLAVKAAYQLGLHSPNSLKHFDAMEREMRIRTWYACIMLDRTLSMTMGRPCAIPENFVRLELPSPMKLVVPNSPTSHNLVDDSASTGFFVATIKLYKIMGEVVDLLYGSNLGVDLPDNIFDTASHILRIEQKFLTWKQNLPPDCPLVEAGSLLPGSEYSDNLRFRVILTLRFLNLRILTHRPLFCSYLEAISEPSVHGHRLTTLRQMGGNSVQSCVHSAIAIIKLMRFALDLTGSPRHLLGAWWFSLYYAFNAALVIFATLLLRHQATVHNETLVIDDWGLSIQTLHDAIECLSMLARGNRMTEKCVRYTSALAHILTTIYQPQATPTASDTNNNSASRPHLDATQFRADFQSAQFDATQPFNMFDSTDLHIGMDMNDLFSAATFENLSQFGAYFYNNGGIS